MGKLIKAVKRCEITPKRESSRTPTRALCYFTQNSISHLRFYNKLKIYASGKVVEAPTLKKCEGSFFISWIEHKEEASEIFSWWTMVCLTNG
jgi:hypothetical protein